ncbi:MAG: CPBP family intramembrane metalloprotease [Gemmatimonadota bacterium]|nr:CPBP family intramembrane metalloprotease [Gemmatimonadota bacterium]
MTAFNERVDEAIGILGRLVAFTAATLLVVFLCGIALKPVFPAGVPPGLEGRVFIAVIVTFALVVAHVVVVALLERAEWQVTGFQVDGWRPLALAIGLIAGLAGVLLPGGILLSTGHIKVITGVPGPWFPFAASSLGVFAALAAMEELIFRGYFFGLLLDRWGPRAAIGCTTAGFALLHFFNPGATAWTLLGVGVAGFFLGMLRYATGSLAAAWLAHVAINWAQAAVFRIPVSGLHLQLPPGFHGEMQGPAWLTGGAWGLEGGVATAAALLLISLLLLGVRAPTVGTGRRR